MKKGGLLSLIHAENRWIALLFFGLLAAWSARGEIIPADRRVTWQGNVGIPGGITNRSTIFANVKNAPYNAKGDGVTDDTAAIQAALNACPAQQVIYVPTGIYKVTSALSIKTNCTVRGDGPGLTIVDGYCPNGEVFGFGLLGDGRQEQYVFGSPGTPVNITSGTSLGSSNIAVSSASGISVGNALCIDEINDTNGLGVIPIGNEGFQNTCGRKPDRMLGQIVLVTAVNGTTITFDPPLVWWFTNLNSAQAVPFRCVNKYAGVENLTVYNNNTGGDNCFTFYSVAYCWLKNIESGWADGDHLCVDSSVRCEIRDSYFHDAYLHTPGIHDSTLRLQGHSSGLLIENNILRRMHIGIMNIGGGGNGAVIAYNFMTNQFDSGSPTAMFADVTYHGAHTVMTLYEGNVMNSFYQDGIWGTSSHGTLLRNFLSGQDWICPPYTGRGPEQTNSYQKQIASVRAISLAGAAVSKYFNVVGNLLGTTNMGNYPNFRPVYINVWPATQNWDHEGYVFALGYANGSDAGSFSGDNNLPFTTLLNHGNWDAVTKSIQWSNNISDRTIPQSYYLSSKPAWFGNLSWPPFNPTNPAPPLAAIPAQYRYFYGTNPPAGVVNQAPIANGSATPINGPAPVAVSFSSAGSYDPEGATLSYSWAFGDGGTSTAANPSHSYQTAGTYNAQLSVSDGTNTASSVPITVRVTVAGSNQPPIGAASASPGSGVAPLSVAFSSAGSFDPVGATLSYNWTFGDGGNSTGANPSHVYTSAGSYSAWLSVSDGTNSTSSSVLGITVTNQAPTVVLTSPTNGASYNSPATITCSASVTANGHAIARVQFYNGAVQIGQAGAAPYSLVWTNVAAGSYNLTAQAVYDSGSTITSGTVAVTVLGLVAAYNFQEGVGLTVTDASANGNNGTITGASWTTAGQSGNALSLNGSNALITVSDSPSLDLTTDITLEAWVYPTAIGGWKSVLFKPFGSSGICYVLQGSSSVGDVPSFGLSASANNLLGTNALLLNTWSHLAATYDNATMRLYVNGTQVASQAHSGMIATSTDPLTIGGNSNDEDFAGIIDEVRIYNRALTAAEIQSDMNRPIGRLGPPTNLRIVLQ